MLTGCTRETAGKALAELEQDGRIRTQGRSIIVPELPAASGESGMR